MTVSHESFLQNVKDHTMIIENDNGVFRSVFFGVPGKSNQHFRLVTWPGHLAISGDMGDFIFARSQDMFEFFRSDCGSINPGYWGEKLQAISKFGGHKEFDWDTFIEKLTNTLHASNDQERGDIENTVTDLCRYMENDEFSAVELARNWDSDDTGLELDACDLGSSDKLTYQYIWCLYAIVWGINKYDASSKGKAADLALRIANLLPA